MKHREFLGPDLLARFTYVARERGITIKEISEKVGMPYSSFHSGIVGRSKLTEEVKKLAAEILNCDVTWLFSPEDLTEIPEFCAGERM